MLLTSLAFGILYVAAKTGGDQTFVTAEMAEKERAAAIAAIDPEIHKHNVEHHPDMVEVPPAKLDPTGKYAVDDKGEYRAIQHKVSPLWLILAYMVISLGELMLSPMGLSLVSKVAPAQMRGMMMGGWFVATALGNKLTYIGVLWTKWYHSSFWLLCSLSALGMGIVLIILLRPLKKAMPGV
jgi:MFS family permease